MIWISNRAVAYLQSMYVLNPFSEVQLRIFDAKVLLKEQTWNSLIVKTTRLLWQAILNQNERTRYIDWLPVRIELATKMASNKEDFNCVTNY